MVDRLPVPKLLCELIAQGTWLHPGDDVLRRAFPLLIDPLDFLASVDGSPINTYLGWPAASSDWTVFRMYLDGNARPLPWLDARRAVFFAVNRTPGDDVAIALDFRKNLDRPGVVASRYLNSNSEWFALAEDFEDFWRTLRSAKA